MAMGWGELTETEHTGEARVVGAPERSFSVLQGGGEGCECDLDGWDGSLREWDCERRAGFFPAWKVCFVVLVVLGGCVGCWYLFLNWLLSL
jgi:hypothetical protein